MQGALSPTGNLQSRTAAPAFGDRLRLTALVVLLAGLGAAGTALEPSLRPVSASGEALNSAGWEGRRLFAQLMWLKTHTVMHAGVEHRDARAGEAASRADEFHGHGGESKNNTHAGHDHAGHSEAECPDGHAAQGEGGGHVFAIPPPREDFRGVIGELERAIKPYGSGYSKDADQTLPFYRLVTWADPYFVQGYVIGASFLSRAGQHADEGLALLREGERHNPRSFEIQTELGHFYLVYKKDYPQAERHLAQAVAWVPQRKLTEMESDTMLDAYRWRALNFVEWDRPAEAVRAARQGLPISPLDPTFRKILERHGKKQ
jgi:hypothetical protein